MRELNWALSVPRYSRSLDLEKSQHRATEALFSRPMRPKFSL